ncbi:helix-turn-helix domain-containing protein [Noviherbaspirillum galbum]|uniref:Helix-turn-helix transcriptional regulator n=1 Tax=Noviherbaspirillum galbum TaxID=2709383 RepID=A0A6B3SI68_9BURK|nr:helix-turn-helix transcriptional regulator [Noviherbaspirillum galbum]NEX60547.1 helix-turn-helix transcriptional regulator [Noviherbaspirillum galbum]
MAQALALVDALKRELKSRGITYADLAGRIGMSEASVKRMFSQKNFTLQRLDDILKATDIRLGDIAAQGGEEAVLISELSHAQEKEIMGDPLLLLVAVSVLNQLSVAQIVDSYQVSEADVVRQLARLDRIGILELLPNNRIKLLVSRTFRWLPNGPIQAYFREQAFGDYLDSHFDGEHESIRLVNVMLSRESIVSLLGRLKQVAKEFADQHRADARLPFDERFAMSFMLAARPWMPRQFKAMLRQKPPASRVVRGK